MLEASLPNNFSHNTFVLRGFPELQKHRRLLALPFSVSYLSVLLGNSLLIYVIHNMETLHSPMYVLICMLCVVDIMVATTIVPNILLGLLFDAYEISLAGCLTQMFFTHFLSSLESTLLLAMALDRYVAICLPLRYSKIINSSMFVKLLLFTAVRSGSVMGTLVGLAGALHFCDSNVIQHCYCDHMALVSLACDSTEKNRVMGLAVILCFVGVDVPLIFLSYMKILKVVLRAAPAGEDRWKAFHTCGTHLIIMMCFYLVGSVTFLSHNLNIPIPTDVNTFLGLMYILFPATVNPIIYGIRTKEIRKGFFRIFKLSSKKTIIMAKVFPVGRKDVSDKSYLVSSAQTFVLSSIGIFISTYSCTLRYEPSLHPYFYSTYEQKSEVQSMLQDGNTASQGTIVPIGRWTHHHSRSQSKEVACVFS